MEMPNSRLGAVHLTGYMSYLIMETTPPAHPNKAVPNEYSLFNNINLTMLSKQALLLELYSFSQNMRM